MKTIILILVSNIVLLLSGISQNNQLDFDWIITIEGKVVTSFSSISIVVNNEDGTEVNEIPVQYNPGKLSISLTDYSQLIRKTESQKLMLRLQYLELINGDISYPQKEITISPKWLETDFIIINFFLPKPMNPLDSSKKYYYEVISSLGQIIFAPN